MFFLFSFWIVTYITHVWETLASAGITLIHRTFQSQGKLHQEVNRRTVPEEWTGFGYVIEKNRSSLFYEKKSKRVSNIFSGISIKSFCQKEKMVEYVSVKEGFNACPRQWIDPSEASEHSITRNLVIRHWFGEVLTAGCRVPRDIVVDNSVRRLL